MEYISTHTNEYGIIHESLFPFDDNRIKIVKNIQVEGAGSLNDFYLLTDREYDEYINLYYHLFSQSIGNDFYWSFPSSETTKFSKSEMDQSDIYENKIINEWNITITTDTQYMNDNIQIEWRKCDSYKDYIIENEGKCVNKNKVIKYKLKKGMKCISTLKEEDLIITVGCKSIYYILYYFLYCCFLYR